MNTTSVDAYLKDGCGRCDHYQTPQCKVNLWTQPLTALRALVLSSGLVEEMKWGSPCYTLKGKNVVMLVSRKDCCALQFMNGGALKDDDGLLVSPGPSSRYARLFKFHSLAEVEARRERALELIEQAIAQEQSDKPYTPPPANEPIPEELSLRLEADPLLNKAFEALTPGRRRSHILHISGAKQSETRVRRIERCVPVILAGRGFNER